MNRIVLLYLGRRGAGPEYAFEMAKALAMKTTVLCIISSYISNRKQWIDLASGNDHVSIYEIPTFNSFLNFLLKSLNLNIYRDAISVINKFNPDMIYSPMGHFWERLIVPFCKCKCTVRTIHDITLHEGENGWKYQITQKIFSYKSEKYVILSKAFKKELMNRGIAEEQIIVIPHAVFKGYSSSPIEEDYHQYNRFLFFGRIIKYKGVEVLLAAMSQIATRIPDATLVIAGNGDIAPYKVLIDSCSRNLELHVGWIENYEVEGYFKNVDFVVLPYTHASQSGVIPLAYFFGKPVIATKLGGLPEQVEEGKTGILVDAGNEQQLVDAVVSLFSNKAQMIQMKRACYEYAEHNTWDSSVDLLLGALN